MSDDGRRRCFCIFILRFAWILFVFILCLARQTENARRPTHTHTRTPDKPIHTDRRQQWNNLYRFSSFCVFYFENVIIFSALGLLAYCSNVLGRSQFFGSIFSSLCVPPQMHHDVAAAAAAISDYTLSFVRKFISSAFVSNTRLIRCQEKNGANGIITSI